MSGKQLSGYCRSTAIIILILLALCVTAASAAVVNPNLVSSKVTQIQVATITREVFATCPAGYDCMTLADAAAQLGTYTKYSDAVCGHKQSSATVAVIQIDQFCVKKMEVTPTPVVCPTGCSCMMESAAKEKFGTYSRCSATPCNTVVTGSAQLNAYCFRQGTTTTPPCPEGCSCISEATANAKGGSWSRCSADICGYDQSTATLAAVIKEPKYCMKQLGTTPVCQDGCTCISEATAKERYGTYTRCSAEVCGYEQDQTKKYCIKQGSTTPVCPDGCVCLSEEKAKQRYGTYTRCTAEICGKEMIQPAGAAAYSVPQYCVKQGSTPVCPQGCYCLQDAEAKLKFGPNNYTRCQADPCDYDPSATSANGIPRYCFKPTITAIPFGCPQGCVCTTNATAVDKGLKFCGGKLVTCGYNENQQPQYCFSEGTTQACPQGCVCMTNATAVDKGLTFCGGKLITCGYNENKQPQYCFGQAPSPTCMYDYQKNVCTGNCPEGYTCGLLASKKDATGKVTYGVCGCTGQPTTACAYDTQKNACTGTCANQQSCAIVGKKVDDKTGETFVVCGCPTNTACTYNYAKDACVGTCTATGEICQLNTIYRDPATGKVGYAECHCKGQPTTACSYDTQKNTCTGTCANQQSCEIVGRKVDDKTGDTFVVCGCPQPTSGQCTFDKEKQACTGTCQSGAACTILGKKTDDKTGEVYVSCGCPPQPSSCVYDYSKEACAGTCSATGDICQLNTIYRDPTTGKVTYAECHCKGGGEVPETCTCDTTTGTCSGSCAGNRACTMVEKTTDNAGKILCSKCECRDTCVLTANNECSGTCADQQPCTRIVSRDNSGNEKVSCGCGGISPAGGAPSGTLVRQPGFLDGIFSFFNKLFGGK